MRYMNGTRSDVQPRGPVSNSLPVGGGFAWVHIGLALLTLTDPLIFTDEHSPSMANKKFTQIVPNTSRHQDCWASSSPKRINSWMQRSWGQVASA